MDNTKVYQRMLVWHSLGLLALTIIGFIGALNG